MVMEYVSVVTGDGEMYTTKVNVLPDNTYIRVKNIDMYSLTGRTEHPTKKLEGSVGRIVYPLQVVKDKKSDKSYVVIYRVWFPSEKRFYQLASYEFVKSRVGA